MKIDSKTKLIVQGITHYKTIEYCKKALNGGTNILAGVGRAEYKRTNNLGVPVYKSVSEAKDMTGATATIIYVPPLAAASAVIESIHAEIPLIVCVTAGMSHRDKMKIKSEILHQDKSRLLGPGSPGIIAPGQCNIGLTSLPNQRSHRRGKVGIVSRSVTLLDEAIKQTTRLGLGQTLCVCLGNDPAMYTDFVDCLTVFLNDPNCHGIILIGESNGYKEEVAAEYIMEKNHTQGGPHKPIVSYISDGIVPLGTGYAGIKITEKESYVRGKIYALKNAGVIVTRDPAQMGLQLMREMTARSIN